MFEIFFEFSIPPIRIETIEHKNIYAEHIPYETLFENNTKRNKNTIEYNTIKTEEMINESLEKMIIEIFSSEEVDL